MGENNKLSGDQTPSKFELAAISATEFLFDVKQFPLYFVSATQLSPTNINVPIAPIAPSD